MAVVQEQIAHFPLIGQVHLFELTNNHMLFW